jgi:hypothetical protein
MMSLLAGIRCKMGKHIASTDDVKRLNEITYVVTKCRNCKHNIRLIRHNIDNRKYIIEEI